jgi:type IV fimbrial biogenesis protein FimT
LKNSPAHGFTLIEALVTIALLAIVLALGMPSLRGIMVSTKIASISNEFSTALQHTRALAIGRNSCATLCAASNVSATATSTTATCSALAATNNFQSGWVIFENPSCDATLLNPTVNGNVVNIARRGEAEGYAITPSAAALSLVMFDPRGFANLTAAGNFQVAPPSGEAASYKRTICIDAAGRAVVRQYTTTCS